MAKIRRGLNESLCGWWLLMIIILVIFSPPTGGDYRCCGCKVRKFREDLPQISETAGLTKHGKLYGISIVLVKYF